jgi:hypothetical protein
MQSLIASKVSFIRAAMRDAPLKTVLTEPIRSTVHKLLTSLDTAEVRVSGGSETQQSSSRTEKIVLDLLGVPLITKSTGRARSLFNLPMFAGDYFGFKRAVEHRNECRFVLPEADGVYAIHQPYGSQANPDILLLDVRSKAIVCQFGIEIKSGGPTWNTHIQFADRSMLYIAFKGEGTHYFFGDHIRNKESLILALAWDELQRELANALNEEARANGLKNMCVPYPKQEFRGQDLEEGSEARHTEIKEWLSTSPGPSA